MGRTGGDDDREANTHTPDDQSHYALGAEGGDSDAELLKRLSELRIGSGDLFMQATEQTRMAIVIVDPYGEDQPIVYVNRAFTELTGYPRKDVIGRNCRFLQGKETDPSTVREIRRCLDAEEVAVVQILNYRLDGTPFWNSLHIGPVYDTDGKLAYFYGSQWDVTQRIEKAVEQAAQQRSAAELQHRLQNLFAVMSAIVRLSARGETDAEQLSKRIVERIEALARAQRASIGVPGADKPASSVGALIEAVLEPYRNADGHRIALDGEDIALPSRMVTPIGVALHELATNAIKYGALGDAGGDIAIAWRREGDTLSLDWVEDQIPPEARESKGVSTGSGSGSRIVRGVLGSLGGSIESEVSESGYRAHIEVPLPTEDEAAVPGSPALPAD